VEFPNHKPFAAFWEIAAIRSVTLQARRKPLNAKYVSRISVAGISFSAASYPGYRRIEVFTNQTRTTIILVRID
jgi:hypothetical protein